MSCAATATAAALFAFFFFFLLLMAVQAQNLGFSNHSFPQFDDKNETVTQLLQKLGNATFSHDAMQLTPDTTNNPQTWLVNQSGRILLKEQFKIWHDEPGANNSITRRVASFNTVFTFNIFRPENSTAGEGLAFGIFPDLSQLPAESTGGYLGLTNKTLDGNGGNHFIAVELDTVQQHYDPDDNHIGLNINGVNSIVAKSLSPFNITIAPEFEARYTVWIDYDGGSKNISAYIARENSPKPTTPMIAAPLDISQYLNQSSYFGFSGSTGKTYELNCVLSWNLTVENLTVENPTREKGWPASKTAMAIGIPAAAVTVLVAVIVGVCCRRRREPGVDSSSLSDSLNKLPGMPREFTYKELKRATNNFDEKNKLGQGGFGVVYKGVIAGDKYNRNVEVAVKMFLRDNSRCQDDFLAELTIINRLRHRHLVPLVGWCHRRGVLLLVYDYMPNGSLDKHLFGGEETTVLPWDRRYSTIVGVASALHYLHNDYDQTVVHRDLKPSNVMLDGTFQARLGDFGLARALDVGRTSYAEIELDGVPGTMGYIAPECFHTGKATRESDAFSFGAVILEIVCGRHPRCDIGGYKFLADWVWKLHREERILDAVDPRLAGDFDHDEAQRLLLLGLACSHPLPGDRPKTVAIMHILAKSQQVPSVPPFRPAFMWPSFIPEDSVTTANTTAPTTSSSLTAQSWSNYARSLPAVWSSKNVGKEVNLSIHGMTC